MQAQNKNLSGKKILLCITGGIAAYKSLDIASALKKLGAKVIPVCTDNALKFVSALSLQTITGSRVFNQQYIEVDNQIKLKADFEIGADIESSEELNLDTKAQALLTAPRELDERDGHVIEHINLADAADLLLLAPTTANTIAKISAGIADNLVLDTILATSAPVMVAPAMNTKMWDHPTTQKNIKFLEQELNYEIIDPASGELACGHVGQGKLATVDEIVAKVKAHFSKETNLQSLLGKRVLVTAGGTRENIDPVRFIGNRSSGKMGKALAQAALEAGAEVTVVSSVDFTDELTAPVHFIKAENTQEMLDGVIENFAGTDAIAKADVLIMAAAVSDYRPKYSAESKLKKDKVNISIELEPTPDILQTIIEHKVEGQKVVGFALETDNILDNAKSKLGRKQLDIVVANDPSAFDGEHSQVSFIDSHKVEELPAQSKLKTARVLMQKLNQL